MRTTPLIAALALAIGATAAETPAIRVVDCDQPVRSTKRGICANHLQAEDFTALAPGVGWFYNWFYTSGDVPAAELKFEFIPMAWGNRPDDLAGLEKYLAAHPAPRAVLAINEPNLKGQAFIPPETCAELYGKIAAIAAPHHVPVVGPNMALGSAPNDSIKAMDPIEKKDVTYGWFVPYLKAFHHFAGPKADKTPVGVHSYKDIYELKWAVETSYKEFGGPVWVTEFAQWGAGSDEAERNFMIQAVDYLERTPYVAGYAWFKERADHKRIALFDKEAGKLTELGQAYVRMPVHDADVYYRIPGRLQAENYLKADKMEPKAVDGDGFLSMDAQAAGGWVECNIMVEKAGPCTLALRVSGEPGTVKVLKGSAAVATAKVAGQDWETVEVQANLAAGAQTLRFQASAKKCRLDWVEFKR